MYAIAVVLACLVGASQASYLAPLGAPLAAPLVAPAPFTTTAHVGNVATGVSRAYTNVPQSRFTRTDWNQPGSLITAPIHAPIIAPVFGNIAVPGPTRYEQFLVPNPPRVLHETHYQPGVAHVPTVAHVPAAVPVAAPAYPVPAAPVAAAPAYPAPAPVKGYY